MWANGRDEFGQDFLLDCLCVMLKCALAYDFVGVFAALKIPAYCSVARPVVG